MQAMALTGKPDQCGERDIRTEVHPGFDDGAGRRQHSVNQDL